MHDSYSERYKELCLYHWWWRARLSYVLEALTRASSTRDPERTRILDVGCADGVYFDRFSRFGRVTGLEPNPALYSGSNANVVHADLEEFSADQPFDIVLMLDVLEHLVDERTAVEKLHRLLVPGGVLILTVPAHEWLWTSHDDLNNHQRRYNRASLVKQFAGNAWSVSRVLYMFPSLVAPKLFLRMLESFRRTPPRTPVVPAPLINRTAELVLEIERLILKKFPIPLGSSLLLVANRRG